MHLLIKMPNYIQNKSSAFLNSSCPVCKTDLYRTWLSFGLTKELKELCKMQNCTQFSDLTHSLVITHQHDE